MRCFLALLLMISFALNAADEIYDFDDPGQRALFLTLSESLRCPKCQNQSIAGSNALVAQDMKRKVYQLLQQGYTEQEIIDYMKQRYGDFVYYQPPLNPLTLLLWMGPALFVLLVLGILIRRRNKPAVQADSAMLAKAEKWLEEDK
ncbi:cytochrome c-type biogenesis protein [Lacimicrobium alkaliphilum]|uniref:Cytochrome c-type biogenesis protein n=1 Tax=Lacimicrobium alkaliphilum TaxID=1526571 RepID=A0ABQ1RJV7_9ALTE|nr:cytochrome c-type biogenesis protein [Lacimicrobium alkaliphilum]GGD72692.1 cystathionine gamma-synthase [Lacimicrobium alkaliphilum]